MKQKVLWNKQIKLNREWQLKEVTMINMQKCIFRFEPFCFLIDFLCISSMNFKCFSFIKRSIQFSNQKINILTQIQTLQATKNHWMPILNTQTICDTSDTHDFLFIRFFSVLNLFIPIGVLEDIQFLLESHLNF